MCLTFLVLVTDMHVHELVRMGMSWDPNQSYLRIDYLPDFVNILAVGDIRELSVTLTFKSLCFFFKKIDRPTQALCSGVPVHDRWDQVCDGSIRRRMMGSTHLC